MLPGDAQHTPVPIECWGILQSHHVVKIGAPLRQTDLPCLVGIAASLQGHLRLGHAIQTTPRNEGHERQDGAGHQNFNQSKTGNGFELGRFAFWRWKCLISACHQ